MRRIAAILALALGLSLSGPPRGEAQHYALPYNELPYGLIIIVEAWPTEANVILNGRPLGSARRLLGTALKVPPGRHTLAFVAPGFKPWVAEVARRSNFPILVRARLEHE